MINIYTKKRLDDGAAGSVDGQLANRSSQVQTQLAWRKHRWLVNADAGRYTYHYNSYSILSRADPSSHLQQTNDFDERAHNEYAAVGGTWLIDSLTSINLRYQYGQGHGRSGINLDNQTSVADSLLAAWTVHTDNPTRRRIHTVNWGFFGASRNRSLEYDVMATGFDQRRVNNYTQTANGLTRTGNSPVETSHGNSDNRELAVQADATKKLNRQMTLEVGAKTAFRQFHNQNILNPDSTNSNRFYFHRSILAAYFNYTLSLGDWKMRLGLRYEQTHWPLHFADTALTPPDYRNFLPNGTVNYNWGQGQSLSAGYTRKLIRPYIDNLNPVVNYIDSLNLQYGNPGLRPAYSNNYEFEYSYRKTAWLLNISLFLRDTRHSIENIRILRPGGVIASTYSTIANNRTSGLTANLFLQPKKVTVNFSNTLAYLVFNSEGYPQRRGFEFSTGVDCSYKPTPTLTFSGIGYFNTRHINLQGSRGGWRNYSLMINKEIANTGLSFSFRTESFFAAYQYITEKNATETFAQSTLNRFVNRSVRFGATWKFGKKEVKTLTSRTITVDN